MSKLKWLATVVLLACCANGARGQCTGQYANDPTYPVLLPQDYAAQGGTTATVTANVNNLAASIKSHKITVAGNNGNLWLDFDYNSANTNNLSPFFYYTIDGGTTHYSMGLGGVSGHASGYWIIGSGNIGHYYTPTFGLVDSNGNVVTSDRVTITVVNDTADTNVLVQQDSLETNFYQQVITTFGGSSMLTSCQECQAGTTQHCINATHTPYSTISLTNSTSGESQSLPWQQAGNIARSNESVGGSAALAISVLPGDSGTISIENKITCIMDGIIFDQQLPKPKTSPSGGSWNPSVTGELAFTKVALKVPTHCTPLVDPNGNVIGLHCDVAYYCSARSSPPDYQPTGLDTYHYTNPALVPPFWMSMAPGSALVFGRNQPGEIAIWYFPFATLHGVLINMGGTDPLLLDILSPAWVSDNSTQDCTKWISGISPWYMPKW